MTTHPLDIATRLDRVSDSVLAGTTNDDYWNFAGPFGGYIAALFMKAVMIDPRRLGPPVAQTVNFCAALPKGDFEIAIKLARGGKATQHWSLELMHAGEIAATCSIVCANRRETFSHSVLTRPDLVGPESVPSAPPDVRLPWLKNYEFKFVEGGRAEVKRTRDEQRLGTSRTALWLKDVPDRPLDYVALAALCDCFILRLVQMRGTLVPMGTVSLTSYFHALPEELEAQGTRHLLGIADAKRFEANFHDQWIELWGADGRLIANGVQVAWYKE
ncbi:MAG TPA: thioesterase family protein [Hyphomicrobiaceae bacterium]|nr:thioesterase family protein [Hyphomicrobiaceae bacterium]